MGPVVNVALGVGKRCCICWGLKGCKDFCGKTCWCFLVPTCPSQRGRTLKCRSTVPAYTPNKMYTSTSPNVNLLLTFYTWTWTEAFEFLIIYYKMYFISFMDSWNMSSPGINICYKMIIDFVLGSRIFATKWRLGFIIQKSFKKTLATKWQSGCLLQNGFPESFLFFGRISEWSFCSVHKPTHSVVEIQRGIHMIHVYIYCHVIVYLCRIQINHVLDWPSPKSSTTIKYLSALESRTCKTL